MCMGDPDFGPEWSSERWVTARKPHRCGECGRTIIPKERYERVAGVWDGDFLTQLTCEHCVVARGWLERVCSTWLYNAVLADMQDHEGEGYGDAAFCFLNHLGSQDWRIHPAGRAIQPTIPAPTVPIDLVRKLVRESLAFHAAKGHLGRERWAA